MCTAASLPAHLVSPAAWLVLMGQLLRAPLLDCSSNESQSQGICTKIDTEMTAKMAQFALHGKSADAGRQHKPKRGVPHAVPLDGPQGYHFAAPSAHVTWQFRPNPRAGQQDPGFTTQGRICTPES